MRLTKKHLNWINQDMFLKTVKYKMKKKLNLLNFGEFKNLGLIDSIKMVFGWSNIQEKTFLMDPSPLNLVRPMSTHTNFRVILSHYTLGINRMWISILAPHLSLINYWMLEYCGNWSDRGKLTFYGLASMRPLKVEVSVQWFVSLVWGWPSYTPRPYHTLIYGHLSFVYYHTV